ncbi:MAG: polyprenyl synthetase family protein [Blautia sp.]|nr:polyprenyl synthetase family protein [Blautia sp.]
MGIAEEIAARAAHIDEVLLQYLPGEETGYATTLRSAMEYSVTAGGKRLRPLLLEAAYEMFGGRGERPYPFMAAIECIHTYSLVHDDLPAMDNDEYRRGKKTTHAVYGEAMGILAGDALLNHAYEIVAEAMVKEALEHGACDVNMARAFACLSSHAGAKGMVGGQSVDVESEGTLLQDREREVKLTYIYRCKTAALLQAALMMGAILAGAGENEVGRLQSAGGHLGMAFQIQDDILDVTSTLEVLGKPIGSDEKNNKATYVALYGMEQARREVERQSEEAVMDLEGMGDSDFLKALFRYLINREK